MFSSQEGPENLQKPPLNVLLGSLIGCNLVLSIFTLFLFFNDIVNVPVLIYIVLFLVMLYALKASFADCLGLNVFYYFQIVPTRQPFLIWVKKYIKLFIYLMMFFDRIFFLFGFILIFFPERVVIPTVNITGYYPHEVPYYLIRTDFGLRCFYFLACLGIMVVSNTSTVLYLWRHVKRMQDSSSFSALQYQTQKRVAILSIAQTVLFFFFSAGLITYEFELRFYKYTPISHFDPSGHILCSGLAFYSFGTTIILGVGQAKFRHRAADIWKKLGRAISGCNLNG
ncbi:uncharacterized protein [Misgurnus anguillicaudatus]|uniref:uncharacterized protein n=1 Tax=Misgurnus anguillicaudatus TaxID=75329 RepID=UPI003CCF0182